MLGFIFLLLQFIAGNFKIGPSSSDLNSLDPKKYYFFEDFNSREKFEAKWIKSSAGKSSDGSVKYNGTWQLQQLDEGDDQSEPDYSLFAKNESHHHAIATHLNRKISFVGATLIVQYQVRFPTKMRCGGAYIKLLSDDLSNRDLTQFGDASPFSIMFGPDKCGSDAKLHFIFMNLNRTSNKMEEKHLKTINSKAIEKVFYDGLYHLYRLKLHSTNTYEIDVDQKTVASGSLYDDFDPPVNPPEVINDPDDVKPLEWDDRETIPDPTAQQPDDWEKTHPQFIPDSSAEKPADWLDDEQPYLQETEGPEQAADSSNDDSTQRVQNPNCPNMRCGKWSPPMVPNPGYVAWEAPMISNPDYKGQYKPRLIQNPNFYKDDNPYGLPTVIAVGFELWTIDCDISFDNILITNDQETSDLVALITAKRTTSWQRLRRTVKLLYFHRNKVIASVSVIVISYLAISLFGKRSSSPATTPAAEETSSSPDESQTTPEAESDEDPMSSLRRKTTGDNAGKPEE